MKKSSCLLVLAFSLCGWIGVLPQLALAQGNRLESEDKLKEFEKLSPGYIAQIMQGDLKIEEKQKKDIALMAKYYVYYMTIPERQKDGTVFNRRDDFILRMEGHVLYEKHKAKNKDFRTQFAHELVNCFKAVFARNSIGDLENDMLSCLNAAMMLPTLGKMDSVEVLDFFVDQIRDPGKPAGVLGMTMTALNPTPMGHGPLLTASVLAPSRSYGKHDVIKLYAFKGLREYFSHSPPTLNPFANEKDRKQVADRLQPLIDYVLNPPTQLETKAEIDGYRYIRCEAIKALAQVPLPAVPEAPALGALNPKDREKGIMAPVAYALMRVLANDENTLFPAPSFAEKIEATLGLCNVNGKLKLEENLPSRYNEEMAVALVGQFLVHYVQEYIKDRSAVTVNIKLPPRIHWKAYTDLLKKGLTDFTGNLSPEKKAGPELAKIVAAVDGQLTAIRNYKTAEPPTELINVLKFMPAPAPAVYQKSEYEIKLRWPPF